MNRRRGFLVERLSLGIDLGCGGFFVFFVFIGFFFYFMVFVFRVVVLELASCVGLRWLS